ALSIGLIVSAIVKNKPADGVDWTGVGKALGTWLAFAVSALLMTWIGFIVSFALLASFLIVAVFREPPLTAALVAVAASAGFNLVSPLALGVSLPSGVFGF